MNKCLLVTKNILPCSNNSATVPGRKIIPTRYFHHLFSFVAGLMFTCTAFAQTAVTDQQKADYKKVAEDRAAKIVNTLSITDSVQYKKVQADIAGQYIALASIQDMHTAALAAIKNQSTNKDKQTADIKSLEEKKSADLQQLHNSFIAKLKTNLDSTQIDKVKDGLTYRVFPLTYAAYLDELPSLTTEQKAKIFDWLKEAREIAMDAESSDKKHAVFGKYKGRINNYLSAAGYDMKKEGEAWQKRIQAAKEAKQTQKG